VREGSILIDATVNADNAAQQAEMMATLQTALASGASFAGFTVESVGLISNSDVASSSDNSEAMKYRDIAIIVGVVIPICLSNFLIYLSHHLHCAYHFD
jgi:capsular polysaccharide biosynthesis protein